MLIADRDLLVLEPTLFRDHAWLGQRLASGTATITDGTATFGAIATDLVSARVTAGMVLVHAGVAYEIREVLGTTELLVAPLRTERATGAEGEAWSAVGNRPSASAYVATFSPQIVVSARAVLRMIGIEPDAAGAAPKARDITNPDALTRLIACMTLRLIFAAAATPGAQGNALLQKAEWYRRQFNEERPRVRVEIDLDGDGLPDTVRSAASVGLVRG